MSREELIKQIYAVYPFLSVKIEDDSFLVFDENLPVLKLAWYCRGKEFRVQRIIKESDKPEWLLEFVFGAISDSLMEGVYERI